MNGGLDLAAQSVFGGELQWWSDIEDGPIKVMQHHHPGTPNLGDLKVVDWQTVPAIDILTAGYPCQPFSNAGKRLGTEDPRHLWPWIVPAIGVLRPRIILLENVAAHLRRGFDVVSADLAHLGYRVAWGLVAASDIGAPHGRKRLYVVAADASRELPHWAGSFGEVGRAEPTDGSVVASDSVRERREVDKELNGAPIPWEDSEFGEHLDGRLGATLPSDQDWQKYEPAIRRWERILGSVAPRPTTVGPRGGQVLSPSFAEWMMGIPGRITIVPGLSIADAVKLAGNGVVPQQAEYAIRALLQRLATEMEIAA